MKRRDFFAGAAMAALGAPAAAQPSRTIRVKGALGVATGGVKRWGEPLQVSFVNPRWDAGGLPVIESLDGFREILRSDAERALVVYAEGWLDGSDCFRPFIEDGRSVDFTLTWPNRWGLGCYLAGCPRAHPPAWWADATDDDPRIGFGWPLSPRSGTAYSPALILRHPRCIRQPYLWDPRAEEEVNAFRAALAAQGAWEDDVPEMPRHLAEWPSPDHAFRMGWTGDGKRFRMAVRGIEGAHDLRPAQAESLVAALSEKEPAVEWSEPAGPWDRIGWAWNGDRAGFYVGGGLYVEYRETFNRGAARPVVDRYRFTPDEVEQLRAAVADRTRLFDDPQSWLLL